MWIFEIYVFSCGKITWSGQSSSPRATAAVQQLRNLRVHEDYLRLGLRLGPSKAPVFTEVLTGLRLKPYCVWSPLRRIVSIWNLELGIFLVFGLWNLGFPWRLDLCVLCVLLWLNRRAGFVDLLRPVTTGYDLKSEKPR